MSIESVMNLNSLLIHSAQRNGESVAVVDEEKQWCFSELLRVVERQAAALTAMGIGPGKRVAVVARNRCEYVALYFSVTRLGAVLVPLNWRLTAGELSGILQDADPALLIAEDRFAGVLGEQSWTRFEELLSVEWESGGEGTGDCAVDWQDVVAFQMYTSGTSGKPKGAMLTHGNCQAMTSAWLLDMTVQHGDRFLQVTPLFHVGGMLMVLSTVATGCTLRLLAEFDPVQAIDALEQEGITHTLMVPAMLQWVLQDPHLRGKSFPALRLIVYGAAPMPIATLTRAREWFDCDFLQGYGLTETCGVLLTLTPEDHLDNPQALKSAGRAVAGCQVRVVDEEGRDVLAGENGGIGEIVARGPNLSPGYWNDPEGTAAAWSQGWFHSGDLARIDHDGCITVVDRKKDMILVGGENVYPREVERVLLQHADVADVAVIGIPHSVWGEQVLALVVSARKDPAQARVWIRHCRDSLATFKCPTRIEVLDSLPRNAAGKLLKNELREPFWADQPRNV